MTAATSREQLLIEVIRNSLGKIALDASDPGARDLASEARIIGAVADASEALERLEELVSDA
jgi:hypothetical protein